MTPYPNYRIVEIRRPHDGSLFVAKDDAAADAAIAKEIGSCMPGHDYAVVEDRGDWLRIVKRFTAKIVESSNG